MLLDFDPAVVGIASQHQVRADPPTLRVFARL
jgi:hypothetical protein